MKICRCVRPSLAVGRVRNSPISEVFLKKTATQREGKISHFHAFVGGFLTPRPLLAMCAHISISLRSHHDVVPLDLHLLVRQLLALQLQAAVEEDFFTTKS